MLKAGHDISLLSGGAAYFAALETALDDARHEVMIETYLFHHDASGLRIARALARAAGRGVRVQLVIDGYGSVDFSPEIAALLDASGVQTAVYSPYGSTLLNVLLLRLKRMRRLHRKLCVVDSRIAFCGGINLLDDFMDPNHGELTAPRFDFATRIEGPLVADAHRALARMWTRVQAWRRLSAAQPKQRLKAAWGESVGAARLLRDDWRSRGKLRDQLRGKQFDQTAELTLGETDAGCRANLLLRDNLRNRSRIEQAYLALIRTAKTEIIIANAYFLPGRRLRQALVAAAKRGVKVTLLLQGKYEYFMQYHATHALYGFLLQNGIEVHQYTRSFLHAKVAVVDARFSTVGSSNLDPLSLTLAQEANVLVDDERFANALRSALLQGIDDGAEALLSADYAARSFSQRVRDWFAYGLFRLGVALSGKRY
jgi:cardiolipin synthase A/B